MLQFILDQLFDALFWYLTNCPVWSSTSSKSISPTTTPLTTALEETEEVQTEESLIDDQDTDKSLRRRSSTATTEPESNLPNEQIKTFQIQVCFLDSDQKKICRHNMTVQRSMKVHHIKQQLHRQSPDVSDNVEHWSNLAILFMGKELPDNLEISGCDLGDQSMIHALDSVKAKRRVGGQGFVPKKFPKSTTIMDPTTTTATSNDDIETLNKLPRMLTTIEQEPLPPSPSQHVEQETGEDYGDFEMIQSIENVTDVILSSPLNVPAKLYFFVYCELCGDLRNGKLRVVCSSCDQGSILLDEEPKNWSDVLTPGRIGSKCFTPNCTGDKARFFFKCIDESCHGGRSTSQFVHNPEQNEPLLVPGQVLPLNRIRHNNISAACIACMDSQIPVVLVFPCGHVICLDCFRDYCRTCLSERNLALLSTESSHSYSANCPFDCPDSWLEVDHFRLLDRNQYAMYRRFATEEFVAKNGGMICPYPDCDQPFFPSSDQPLPPESCQINGCSKCQHVYCVRCTFQGQYASMFCQFETLIEQSNAELRKESATTSTTADRSAVIDPPQASSSYLSALIAKFNLLRGNCGGGDSGSTFSNAASNSGTTPPRWQDTMSRMKILEIAKPCPKCRTPTERSEGCMHMICVRKRCHFHWCWICQNEWNNDCMATHWFG